MQQGGEDQVVGMEGVDNGNANGSAIARPEADAAAATYDKEAANQVVAAMSRRVRGGDKTSGTVAGYARPGSGLGRAGLAVSCVCVPDAWCTCRTVFARPPPSPSPPGCVRCVLCANNNPVRGNVSLTIALTRKIRGLGARQHRSSHAL